MKKKTCKRGTALLLAATMLMSTLAGISIKPMEVKAAPATVIGAGYFQENKEDGSFLSAYNLSSADSTTGKIRFAGREWYITGQENGELVLLSSDGSRKAAFVASGSSNKYSNSDLTPDKLLTMFASNFTDAEKALMSTVTVETDENNNPSSKVSATGKLYLPNAKSPSSYGLAYTTIYLGADDSIEVFIGSGTKLSNCINNFFWLRSPSDGYDINALCVSPGYYVINSNASFGGVFVVPACHLNLSSVIFASAATAATSDNIAGTDLTGSADTFTLRYADTTSSATVTYNADGVKTTNENGKYLMVQTTDKKIYTKSITSDDQTFALCDIGVSALTEEDRVWVESTTDRVTYAKLATWAERKTVTISKEGNGTVTGDGTYTENTSATVEATADSGNTFIGWYKGDTKVSDDASYTFTVTEDIALTAKFTKDAPAEYTVTVNNGTGDGNYTEGATVTITADAAPNGKQFKEWKVVSGGVNLAGSKSASTTFTMPASAVEVTAVYEDVTQDNPTDDPVTYKIISGANSVYEEGSGELVIKGDGAYTKFKEVKVDEAVIDSTNYMVTEGSTIITLKAGYLQTLKEGAHTFEIVWTDGSAKTTFTVKAESIKEDSTTEDGAMEDSATVDTTSTEKDEVPKTGDNSPITWLFVLMIISGATVAFLGNKKRTLI